MPSPYESPTSDVDIDETVYQPRLFTFQGRIGRVRYLAYNFLINIVLMFFIGIIAAIAIPALAKPGQNNDVTVGLFMLLLYVPSVIVMFMLAIRRLNDLNRTGWLSPLILVPFLNVLFMLYLLFWPGSEGTNDYGPPATPNSIGLMIVGLLFPIAVIGMLAAIAIPAYHDYVNRGQVVSEQ